MEQNYRWLHRMQISYAAFESKLTAQVPTHVPLMSHYPKRSLLDVTMTSVPQA